MLTQQQGEAVGSAEEVSAFEQGTELYVAELRHWQVYEYVSRHRWLLLGWVDAVKTATVALKDVNLLLRPLESLQMLMDSDSAQSPTR